MFVFFRLRLGICFTLADVHSPAAARLSAPVSLHLYMHAQPSSGDRAINISHSLRAGKRQQSTCINRACCDMVACVHSTMLQQIRSLQTREIVRLDVENSRCISLGSCDKYMSPNVTSGVRDVNITHSHDPYTVVATQSHSTCA